MELSESYGAVDLFAQKVRMTVVPRVLLQHVCKDETQ